MSANPIEQNWLSQANMVDNAVFWELSSQPMCAVDEGGRLRYANQALSQMVNTKPAQLLDTELEQWFHPDDRSSLRVTLEVIDPQSQPMQFSGRLRRSEGIWRQLDWKVSRRGALIYLSAKEPQLDFHHKSLLGFLVRSSDDSETESDSPPFVQAMIDLIPHAFYCRDQKSRYIQVNQKFLAVSGLKREDVLGLTATDIWGEKLGKISKDHDRILLRDGGIQQYDVEFTNARGQLRQLSITKSLLHQEQGKPARILGLARDVTEQMKQERLGDQQNRMLSVAALCARQLMRATQPRRVLDTALSDIRLNCGAQNIYVYRHREHESQIIADLIGCSNAPVHENAGSREPWPSFQYDPHLSRWLDLLEQGFPICSDCDELPQKEREFLEPLDVQSIILVPIHVEDRLWGMIGCGEKHDQSRCLAVETATLMTVGNIIGAAWSRHEAQRSEARANWQVEDLARQYERAWRESERLRRDAEEMARQAQAADHAKTAFLHNMSHEIRTPMTAILGYLDILDQTQDNEAERQKCIDTIRENGDHLMSLINEILELANLESGNIALNSESIDPSYLLRNTLAQYRKTAQSKGLALDLKVDYPIPEKIEIDQARLRQVLDNLISNAIKFTHEGGVTVQVRVVPHQVSENTKHPVLRIAVIDTGIGIDLQDRQRLFRPFCRGNESLSAGYSGTGLGLALTKRIVDAMGMELQVHSDPQKGSTFLLCVPFSSDGKTFLSSEPERLHQIFPETVPTNPDATKASVAQDSEQNQQEAPPESEEQNESSHRLLLAEDDPAIRRLVKLLLKREGLGCETAEDGQEACDAVLQARQAGQPYDLVLMDMQMPRMTGYDATRHLRRRGIQIPIVAVTAQAMATDRQMCLNAGCTDYMSKPIDRQRLADLVWQYLKKPQS